MPICYEFDLVILRFDEDGDETETSMPYRREYETQQTMEQVTADATTFWEEFVDMIVGYDHAREGEYVWGGGMTGFTIYEC